MSSAEEFVLDLPATAAAAAVVRATAAAIAMAHDLPLDVITDVRLAVDEACSAMMPLAVPGTKMRCTVQAHEAHLDISVQVTGVPDGQFTADSVDLRILGSLAQHLDTYSEPATAVLGIRLRMARTSA